MSRVPVAAVAGLAGFVVYVVAATMLGGALESSNGVIQALYYVVAGVAWVAPVRWLMLWSVHQR